MPVWADGKLEAKPFTLRVFAVPTPDGWQVMHGGFCRIAENDDPTARASRSGRSADVWVRSDTPVENVSLLPEPAEVPIRRRIGVVPSRAADNLFWLGRYLERCEATLRVVRALINRSTESTQTERDVNADIVSIAQRLGGGAGGHAERSPARQSRPPCCSSRI